MGYCSSLARWRHYAQAEGVIEDSEKLSAPAWDAIAREKVLDSDNIEIWFADEARIWVRRTRSPAAG